MKAKPVAYCPIHGERPARRKGDRCGFRKDFTSPSGRHTGHIVCHRKLRKHPCR